MLKLTSLTSAAVTLTMPITTDETRQNRFCHDSITEAEQVSFCTGMLRKEGITLNFYRRSA